MVIVKKRLYNLIKLIFFGLILIPVTLQADEKGYRIQGIVLDESSQEPLIGANIFIAQDSLKKFVTTDESGRFYSTKVPAGKYDIKITYIGYEIYETAFEAGSHDHNLGVICLKPEPIPMSAIEVIGKIPIEIQRGDTIVYNANTIAISPNANAKDLLLKMPACYEIGGKIFINGESVNDVFLEGSEFFKDNPDLSLESIPADMIDKIEVYEKKDDVQKMTEADDNNVKKVINIILKPDKNKGIFGDVYYANGQNSINQFGAILNYFGKINRITATSKIYNHVNSDANPNQTDKSNTENGISDIRKVGITFYSKPNKKMTINSSYTLDHKDNKNESELFRYYQLGTEQKYLKNSSENRTGSNHLLNTKVNYKLSDKDKIDITTIVNVNNNEQNIHSSSGTYLGDLNISRIENKNQLSVNSTNFIENIYYEHNFIKNKRLIFISVSGSQSDVENDNTQNYELTTVDDSTHHNFYSNSKRKNQRYFSTIMYKENLGNIGKISLGTLFRKSTVDNKKDTYNNFESISGSSELDSSLSSDLKNVISSKILMLTYDKTINQFKIKCQFNYEDSELNYRQHFPIIHNNEKSYFNWFPKLSLDYKISKNNFLKISYRASNRLPLTTQLDEVLNNENPEYLKKGNAQLNQQYDHHINLLYKSRKSVKNKSFSTKVDYSFSNTYIGYRTIMAGSEGKNYNGIEISPGAQLTMPDNMSGFSNFHTKISYGFPVDYIKSNMLVNINTNFTKTPAYLNENQYYYNKMSGEVSVVLTSDISSEFSFKITNITNISQSHYDEKSLADNIQINQYSNLDLEWHLGRGFDVQTSLNYLNQNNSYANIDNTSLLWNVSFGKALFENQQGDLRLYIYDILNKKRNVLLNSTDIYFEERKSLTIDRYFMLIFNYRIKRYDQQ